MNVSIEEYKKLLEQSKEPQNKYRNKKTTVDGITFDSKFEASRYCELKLLEKAGQIKNLELQKEFELIPAQREFLGFDENNKKKFGGVIERACKYKADFTYYKNNGQLVVEDTKGAKTADYIIKRKLMLYIHGIRIKEIER